MASNLFISYDLYRPGQNYEQVAQSIKNLGAWAKIHQSFWYVKSTVGISDAGKRIWAVMDQNDKLIVIDTTNNSAVWYNLSEEVAKHIRDQWHQ